MGVSLFAILVECGPGFVALPLFHFDWSVGRMPSAHGVGRSLAHVGLWLALSK